MSLESNGKRNVYSDRSSLEAQTFVRICARYCASGAWLEDGSLLRDAARLAGIPGMLVHGRHDLSCPLETAWTLSRAWRGAELVVVDDAGHLGSATANRRVRDALDACAARH